MAPRISENARQRRERRSWAAGVCAVLAARAGKAVRDVPVSDVQGELRR